MKTTNRRLEWRQDTPLTKSDTLNCFDLTPKKHTQPSLGSYTEQISETYIPYSPELVLITNVKARSHTVGLLQIHKTLAKWIKKFLEPVKILCSSIGPKNRHLKT